MSTTDDELESLRGYLRRREQRPLPDGAIDRVARGVRSRTGTPQRPRRILVLAIAALTAASMAVVLGVSLWAAHSRPGGTATGAPAATPTPTPTASATPSTTLPPTPPSASPVSLPLRDVTWSAVDYGLDCAPVGYRVLQVAYASPSPNTTRAVVLLTCAAGAGSPAPALLVFDSATSATTPHLAQTLVTFKDNWVANDHSLTVAATGDISLVVVGYSSINLPRSDADVHATLTWEWRGSAYVETGTEPPHARYP